MWKEGRKQGGRKEWRKRGRKEKEKKNEDWKQMDELHESTYTTYFFYITIPSTDGLTICDWLNSPTWNSTQNSTQRRPVSCEVTCGLSTTLRVGIPNPLYVIQESSVSIHISNTQNEKESYTMTNL